MSSRLRRKTDKIQQPVVNKPLASVYHQSDIVLAAAVDISGRTLAAPKRDLRDGRDERRRPYLKMPARERAASTAQSAVLEVMVVRIPWRKAKVVVLVVPTHERHIRRRRAHPPSTSFLNERTRLDRPSISSFRLKLLIFMRYCSSKICLNASSPAFSSSSLSVYIHKCIYSFGCRIFLKIFVFFLSFL